MQDGEEENTYAYQHATLSSISLSIYNGCVALPQLRKSVEISVGRSKKQKFKKPSSISWTKTLHSE